MLTRSVSRRAVVVTALVGTLSISKAKTIAIDHTPKVKRVDQGNANLCWLAAAAMMNSWQSGGASVTMDALAATLGSPFAELREAAKKDSAKGALSLGQVKTLASKLGLKTEGLKSMSTDWWVSRLTTGPVWIAGYTRGAAMGHAAVITGLKGDTSKLEGLTVALVDPGGGKLRSEAFAKTIKFYEGLAGPATDAVAPQLLFFQ